MTLSTSPKRTSAVRSRPSGVTPFSYLPANLPLTQKRPACLSPSSSRKTLPSFALAGSLKCFRYQPIPDHAPRSPPLWLMISAYESTSFHVCGALTPVHFESSKSACSAPATSPLENFQPELKFSAARGDVGGVKRSAARLRFTNATILNTRTAKNDFMADSFH